MSYRANKILFVDTDAITTSLWGHELFQISNEWIENLSRENIYDHYLLCDVDVPWVEDVQRYLPDEKDRRRFFDMCESSLKERNFTYFIISGSWEARFQKSIEIIQQIIITQ